MSHPSLLRLAPALVAALALPAAVSSAYAATATTNTTTPSSGVSSTAAPAPASSASSTGTPVEEATLLDKVVIDDIPADQSVLPTRPSTSLYGFEETIRETPRSVFQVSKAQIDNDNIQNFSDLSRYSPSIQRASSSPYSVPRIRGGAADTLRNNIVLFNTAVRPFNDNAWESADIVAGVPSVIQGNTSRTAGYVNYVTKKPFFGEDQTEFTVKFGRLGLHSETTYPQYSVQLDHSTELIKDKLAIRFSLLQAEADLYWGNSEADSKDIFGAVAWRPNSKVTVDANFSYTQSEGAIPNGINRLSQNLIDNWVYRAGTAVPTINYGAGGQAANSPTNPATITGWTIQNPHDVKIRGDQTIYSDEASNDADEYIAQVISSVKLNDTFTLRNNTIFQYSDNQQTTHDFSTGGHINKLVESRFELLSDKEFELFGKNIRHQSNSGVSYRWLENTCNVAAVADQANPVPNADATQGGSLSTGAGLGITENLFNRGPGTGTPNSVHPDGKHAIIYSPTYGWLTWTPTWRTGNGYEGIAAGGPAGLGPGLAGGEARINTLKTTNLFSEHKFDIDEKWTWRLGGRLSYVDDSITTNALTKRLVNDGFYAGLNTDDSATAWNGDINTSIAFRPIRWASTYFTYDYNISSQDCGCCQTQGFTGSGNTLSDSYFDVKSELFELGVKFELIPNKLFASAAWFHQTRQIPAANLIGGDPSTYNLIYEGLELAATYQPTVNLALGANYSYIDASYEKTGGRFPFSPLNSANAWVAYRFDNGFGLKANAWITSSWNVNDAGSIKVPTQHSIDLGAFYAARKWRLDIDILNVTNEKNWTPAGGPGGIINPTPYLVPAERLGIQGKFTYRF
ncbi:TonB-dependent receptor [Geminisphaera colitermitum]|uniref:TonB-dependent receptor n=1 Tax=Geminisphaera colitermitum TaxID=1148786 RepID=UPI0001965305|nr:TonB-dependent receptor [Geminisphaera colitermitum]